MRGRALLLTSLALAAWATGVFARQNAYVFQGSPDDPSIAYTSGPRTDAVTQLNRRLGDGSLRLPFEPVTGYLRPVLEALQVPIESQTLVFSKTSFQEKLISMQNPRALYFNDRVAVGWVRGGDLLEVAALDPAQGVGFYTLDQNADATPQFTRNADCLQCHLVPETLGVPGWTALSTFPLQTEESYANGFPVDHRSPFPERWGGWFVTGDAGGARHMGNIGTMPSDRAKLRIPSPQAAHASVEGLFDLTGYATPYSDVAALLVLDHQIRAANLITRAGWEARVAAAGGPDGAARVAAAATELAEYLLFVGEVPLPASMRSTAGFPQMFAALGPADSRGRSLRQMDLQTRMMKYPASYMIYSEAFDALPPAAKDATYRHMWDILSGAVRGQKYARLTLADRRAVVEILRDTKRDLPPYFGAVTR
jgi:hypothetical protein